MGKKRVHISEEQYRRMFLLKEGTERSMISENSSDRKLNRFIGKFLGTDDFGAIRDFLLRKVYGRFPSYRKETADNVISLIDTCYERGSGDFKKGLLKYQSRIASDREDFLSDARRYGFEQAYNDFDGQSNTSETVDFENSQKEIRTPNGYTVTRVDDQEELEERSLGRWCVADDKSMFYEFIGSDGATVYLATADDAEDVYYYMITVTDEYGEEYLADDYYEGGENLDISEIDTWSGQYPYDGYGLSQLIVIVYPGGELSIWSRWNLQGGNDGGHTYLTPQELSRLIGMDCRKAFPYVMGTRYYDN